MPKKSNMKMKMKSNNGSIFSLKGGGRPLKIAAVVVVAVVVVLCLLYFGEIWPFDPPTPTPPTPTPTPPPPPPPPATPAATAAATAAAAAAAAATAAAAAAAAATPTPPPPPAGHAKCGDTANPKCDTGLFRTRPITWTGTGCDPTMSEKKDYYIGKNIRWPECTPYPWEHHEPAGAHHVYTEKCTTNGLGESGGDITQGCYDPCLNVVADGDGETCHDFIYSCDDTYRRCGGHGTTHCTSQINFPLSRTATTSDDDLVDCNISLD